MKMDEISGVTVTDLKESKYIKQKRMHYTQVKHYRRNEGIILLIYGKQLKLVVLHVNCIS